jgi:hypothetical protein
MPDFRDPRPYVRCRTDTPFDSCNVVDIPAAQTWKALPRVNRSVAIPAQQREGRR